MANLLHLKASRTQVLNTFPTRDFGKDGDIVISRITGRGVYLCTKAGNSWYVANKLEELRNVGKASLKGLKVDNLEIKDIPNAQSNTDKFIVSDNGKIKYRSSKEVIDDLSIPIDDITYKQAYCSLEQYSTKWECESNGGTWYYSDNDSHDSISSTAENQLLTIGQSIGTMDAAPTLLYDGSTLEIKRNTYFDENWHTSAQTNLLKLSYDSSNNAIFDVDSSGDLTLDVVGDIILDANGKQINFASNGITMAVVDLHASVFKLMHSTDQGDYFNIAVGAAGVTTISTVDADATVGHLTLAPDGDLVLDPASQKILINATDALYFDGGTHTSIRESSDDTLSFYVGGTNLVDMIEAATNQVNINSSELSIDAAKKLFFDGGGLGNTYITESSADILDVYVGGDKMLALDEANDKITSNATNHVVGLADGTEFSATNSAYAGMILGYTDIGLDEGHTNLSLTTSFVVPTDEFSVSFVAPPSGNVLIEFHIQHGAGSSGIGQLHAGLSTANATSGYAQLEDFHEKIFADLAGRTDIIVVNGSYTLTGLTAGTSYERWIGFKTLSTTGTPFIQWGGNSAGRYPDFIMKAIALPATITT